jgi:hypothetical protein
MKKLVVCVLFSFLFCFADVVYYGGNSKIINCKFVKEDEETIYVNTFVDDGISQMMLLKNIIEAVDYLPVDSTQNSKIIKKTKEDYSRITEIKKEQLEKQKKQEKLFKTQQKKALERYRKEQEKKREIIKSVVKKHKEASVTENSVIYYIEPNIPLLATGTALTTLGIVNLIATINISNSISQTQELIDDNPELDELYEEMFLNPLKQSRRQSIVFTAVFSLAGAIDIYYGFEKVSIDISDNQLNLSYKF